MKKVYRLLISIGVTLIVVFVGAILKVLVDERFNMNFSIKIVVLLSLGCGYITYKMIKPSKKQLIKNTKMTELTYESGVVKARGKLFNDQQIGEWEFFDEQGQYLETKDFGSGE